VEVQMGSTLTKGDGIDAITAGDLLHQLTGIAHGQPPGFSLLGFEGQRPTAMAATVQQQPARQRSWVRMVTEQPKLSAADLIPLATRRILVQAADAAGFSH
jgi:hypothetical protein